MPSGPKTNKYTNRHTEEARARDEERRNDSRAARKTAEEDAKWAETDSKVLKKMDKQREEEQKAAAKAARDAEKKDQLAQEEREMSGKAPAKVTKRQLQKDLSKMLADYDKQREAIRHGGHDAVVEPAADEAALPTANPNKEKGIQPLSTASTSGGNAFGAAGAGLKPALANSNNNNGLSEADNRNIGKRARTMYKSFFAENIDKVKEEHPGLRRSQYNDVVWGMWQKSAANPFVLREEMRNQEYLEAKRRWKEEGVMDDDEDDDEEEEEEQNTGKK